MTDAAELDATLDDIEQRVASNAALLDEIERAVTLAKLAKLADIEERTDRLWSDSELGERTRHRLQREARERDEDAPVTVWYTPPNDPTEPDPESDADLDGEPEGIPVRRRLTEPPPDVEDEPAEAPEDAPEPFGEKGRRLLRNGDDL